tara:strand:+ start:109 stop:507 length:399 start_codon:yes stop_codon:yes gene_type:complete
MQKLYLLSTVVLLSLFACMDQDENKEELIIEDLVVGQGVEAKEGNVITVNYTGWLENGTQFDSSLSPGRDPLVITLGAGEVIQGWDEGIPGMKVGGKRRLTIPPHLAYGNQAVDPIPANSTLIFEVDLLGVT